MNELLYNKLSYFNSIKKKHFQDIDIISAINTLPDEIKALEETKYELLAFSFNRNTGKKYWQTYYGPSSIWKKGDKDILYPDISMVTLDSITYWENRLKEVNNPLLKMRYTGLILDFKKSVTNICPDYKIICAHITASLDVAEGEYAQDAIQNMNIAQHALEKAISKQRINQSCYKRNDNTR